jgi:hypothetical protein
VVGNGYRAFEGHFGATNATWRAGYKQFRYWDGANPQGSTSTSGKVSNSCAQCHGGQTGFENYLANPATTTVVKPVQGMQCYTCHTPLPTDTDMRRLRDISSYAAVGNGVRFPPRPGTGVTPTVVAAGSFADPSDMICATCHSGRESRQSIDVKIGATADTTWTLTFTNPHYYGAAAMIFANEVRMAYEFDSRTYAGRKTHHSATASCVDCHDPKATRHTFEVAEAVSRTCNTAGCHNGSNPAVVGTPADHTTYKTAARSAVDYDGDAAVENLGAEMDGLAAALFAQLRAYVLVNGVGSNADLNLCYSPDRNPYFFRDTDNDGVCQATETTAFTMNPRVLRAAFNYQWYQKEPGAWAHNFDYMAQLLIDSIEHLGGTVTAYTRP